MKKTTVLIADDQPIFRSGLRELLKEDDELEVIGEAADGEEAVGLAANLKPEVIIMDVFMPKLDGIKAAKQINEIVPDSNILMLSGYHYDSCVLAALQAKVAGFLYKGIDINELISAIKSIKEGNHTIDQNAAFNLISDLISSKSGATQSSQEIHGREKEILKLAAKGFTNREIAEKLDLNQSTVQAHLANIFHKLKVHTRAEAIYHAMKQGWVSMEDEK